MFEASVIIKDLPITPSHKRIKKHGKKAQWDYQRKWDRHIEHNFYAKHPSRPLVQFKLKLIRYSPYQLERENLRGSFEVVINALESKGIIKSKEDGRITYGYVKTKPKTKLNPYPDYKIAIQIAGVEETNIHDSLSPREKEILFYIMKGFSNEEIADTIFVSTKAVKWHITGINKKYGTETRSKLILARAKERTDINFGQSRRD